MAFAMLLLFLARCSLLPTSTAFTGFVPPITVYGITFNDLNTNGVQDSGELGISGISVQLAQCSSCVSNVCSSPNVTSSMLTVGGVYLITTPPDSHCFTLTFGTPPGNNTWQFTAPPGGQYLFPNLTTDKFLYNAGYSPASAVSPSGSPSFSPSASVRPSPSESPSSRESPSPSGSQSASESNEPSRTPSPSRTISPSESPTPSPSPSESPMPSESPSESPMPSESPSESPMASQSPSESENPSPSDSQSPEAFPSPRPSHSQSPEAFPSPRPSHSQSPGWQQPVPAPLGVPVLPINTTFSDTHLYQVASIGPKGFAILYTCNRAIRPGTTQRILSYLGISVASQRAACQIIQLQSRMCEKYTITASCAATTALATGPGVLSILITSAPVRSPVASRSRSPRRSPSPVSSCKKFKGYNEHRDRDHDGDDLGYFGSDLVIVAHRCDAASNCAGFNSIGRAKHRSNPNADRWGRCLYVKQSAVVALADAPVEPAAAQSTTVETSLTWGAIGAIMGAVLGSSALLVAIGVAVHLHRRSGSDAAWTFMYYPATTSPSVVPTLAGFPGQPLERGSPEPANRPE